MRKLHYSVVLEWDEEEKLYVATVPALSVSSYGKTRSKALRNAKEAILVTVEGLKALGQPVPEGDAGTVELVEVTVGAASPG
jgi:predicted RNase H-like HicB family nuclease